MGQLINLKCEKCGYETNLGIGAGMLYYDLDTVLTLFDKETQGKIRDAVKDIPPSNWMASKEIGICEKCGKISAIPVFTIDTGDGKTIEYRGKCQCGSSSLDIKDFEKIQDGTDSISCPICGDTLVVSVQGYWD